MNFSLYLQNLKSVFTLLARVEYLTTFFTSPLFETRERILDAWATLVLLLQEVANSNLNNASGLQSVAIKEPIESLKELIKQLIAFTTEEVEKRDDLNFHKKSLSNVVPQLILTKQVQVKNLSGNRRSIVAPQISLPFLEENFKASGSQYVTFLLWYILITSLPFTKLC